MTRTQTALDSLRLTAGQRARLVKAGRDHMLAAGKASELYARQTRRYLEQRDRSIAAAEEAYDAEVAAILGELQADG